MSNVWNFSNLKVLCHVITSRTGSIWPYKLWETNINADSPLTKNNYANFYISICEYRILLCLFSFYFVSWYNLYYVDLPSPILASTGNRWQYMYFFWLHGENAAVLFCDILTQSPKFNFGWSDIHCTTGVLLGLLIYKYSINWRKMIIWVPQK